MIWLIGYFVIGEFLGGIAAKMAYRGQADESETVLAAFLFTFFWPVLLPIAFGYWAATKYTKE